MSLGKYLQKQVDQIYSIVKAEIGIIDTDGRIIACSTDNLIGNYDDNFIDIVNKNKVIVYVGNKTYKTVYLKNKLIYVIFILMNCDKAKNVIELIELNIKNSKMYYDEKNDKGLFYKELLINDDVKWDISSRAKELDINYKNDRVVYIINAESPNDYNIKEVIDEIFPNPKDYVLAVDERNIVLIKYLANKFKLSDIEENAKTIINTLNTELMVNAKIGISEIKNNLAEIHKSYIEARTALLIGRIFEQKNIIYKYNNLGIGRLIYSLPKDLCKLFLSEIFKENVIEKFDNETSQTIQKFFDNNLNVSETSRKLYIHRNTLVYRLDKIQKLTDYDIRKFDDAIIFKFALLVKRYLDKNY